ncbi:family 1 glycosylhydrolase, partial [Thomasclavelia ramosa]
GLMLALQELADRYEKPLFISENGLGAIDTVGENHTINDIYRIQYMKGHIEAMKRAIENGVNLFGYTMWGPI